MQHDPASTGPAEQKYFSLVREFVGANANYYEPRFAGLGGGVSRFSDFNVAAALWGSIWAASRGLWGLLVVVAVLEAIAITQLAVALSGNLGAEEARRAAILERRAEARLEQAEAAAFENAANAEQLARSAEYLVQAAGEARQGVIDAESRANVILITGLAVFIATRLLVGMAATRLLETQFNHWRSDRSVCSKLSLLRGTIAAVALGVLFAITAYRYAALDPSEMLASFPTSRELHVALATRIDAAFEWIGHWGEPVFDWLTATIRNALNTVETALVVTPWSVVVAATAFLAWHMAGPRVAIFSSAALVYIGVIGFWENSMETVALLGTAAILSILIGVPLGVWCARSDRVYRVIRPLLDLMQTVPSFVYLIPIIAFFGTGKTPGVMAAVVFGMPPAVRLTALGLKQVPEDIKEAAVAYGATPRFILFKVELPLAMPSIKAGMNQTVLMCLALVVIAALIGAKGLGEDVLAALQYAANGEGILAGSAILLCAIILDRLIQGKGRAMPSIGNYILD